MTLHDVVIAGFSFACGFLSSAFIARTKCQHTIKTPRETTSFGAANRRNRMIDMKNN